MQVGQIIAEPERLLHDECLNLLRTFKNPNVDKVVDIYILCKESKTATEFAEFKRVIEVFGRVPVIIEPVLKSLRSERLSLKVLDKNLAVIAGKPTR